MNSEPHMYYYMHDITFAEIPDETTLTFSITGCDLKCKGCHSPHLQERKGHVLNIDTFDAILKKYQKYITAVCFLGGDRESSMINLLSHLEKNYPDIKRGLYCGRTSISNEIESKLDYLKLGPYIKQYGALDSKETNQRMYKIVDGEKIDMTSRFWD